MHRSLIVHILLATAACTAAYVAWTQPAESAGTSVVIVPGAAERLTTIGWQEERFDVRVERGEPDVRVTVQRYDVPKKPMPTEANPETQEPTAKPTANGPPRTYPGSQQAEDLFGKLAPLQAARSLGKIAADKLAALGLVEPKSTLTLKMGEQTHTLKIGNATFGSGDSYVLAADGEVYLVSSSTLTGLRHGGSTLLDRNALGMAREEVERLAVTVGERGRELVQRFPEDKAKAFWADPAEPDAKLELVGNWLDRVLRLRVVEIVDEQPRGRPEVEIEMFRGNDSLGTVAIWKPGEKTAQVRSSRYDKTVTVAKATADAIIKDLDNVLSEGR